MKRFAGVLAVLLFAAALLTGCGGPMQDKTVCCNEFSITLPGTYTDYSDKAFASSFDFVYGVGNEAILGFKQDRASLQENYPDIDAKDYATLFVEAAELSCTVTEQDGLVLFTYNASVGETAFTYLSCCFMSDTNFWIVQFYCPTSDFPENEADFLRYLHTVAL